MAETSRVITGLFNTCDLHCLIQVIYYKYTHHDSFLSVKERLYKFMCVHVSLGPKASPGPAQWP